MLVNVQSSARPVSATACGVMPHAASPSSRTVAFANEPDGARTGPPHCPAYMPAVDRQTSRGTWVLRFLLPTVALCALSALFVGAQVLERHLLPDISTGLHHALLTLLAALVTFLGSGAVYLPMRSRRKRLTQTAEQLTQLLESYDMNHSAPGRFENPHVVHCCEALRCAPGRCTKDATPDVRCWHVVAFSDRDNGMLSAAASINRCLGCDVYRRSCPDNLAALGESFNNMMILLENEARQVGRMQAQMVEREKMVAIGQMASGIAHEVGNPLASISSIVQMLKRNKSHIPKTEQLDLIGTHIQRISTIVRQLVNFARPATESWEKIDITVALEAAVRLIHFDPRAKNVEIDFAPPTSLRPTFCLRSQLQQVFINLAINALDAMPDGGRLSIGARMHNGGIEVVIKDTGSGIPTKVGRRIFEPFFTTKEVGNGTGLGLSISYGIIQKHGGAIDFHPTPKKGTTFTVFLPTLEHAPEESHGSTDDTTR